MRGIILEGGTLPVWKRGISMTRCEFTLSANAGVALQFGGARVWADALHCRKLPGFSTLSPALLEKLRVHPAFSNPDVIFYTHCHPDHYSRELTAQALAAWPKAVAVLPEREFEGQLLLTGRGAALTLGALTLRFGRLPHEGPQYVDVPHYGCILESDGFRVLIAGDCAPACAELEEFTGGRPVDAALLDFPWLTLPQGRDFIREVLRPSHLLICHLPFSGDDRWGYQRAAERAASAFRGVPDVRLLTEPFQREFF